MNAQSLLLELTRLTGIIDDPEADNKPENLGGRVDTLRYHVLPDLLSHNVDTIMKALEAQVKREEQPELFN